VADGLGEHPRRLGWVFTIAGGFLFAYLTFALVVGSLAAGSFSTDAAIVILIGADLLCLLVLIGGIRILATRARAVHSGEAVAAGRSTKRR
jgi:biotin transporter BioY